MVSPTKYLKEVKHELDLVTWPTRQVTQKKTIVVMVVSFALALYLGLADYLFQQIMAFMIYN